MIEWDYDEFYEWYKKSYSSLCDDKSHFAFFELRRYNKKFKIESFLHTGQENVIAKLHNLPFTQRFKDVFPFGIYFFRVKQQKDANKKRIYFVFPRMKSANIPAYSGNEPKEVLVADHITFLVENKYGDKKPVKTHITTYTPTVESGDIGACQHTNSYIPRVLEIGEQGYNDIVFKNFPRVFNDVSVDIMRKPYIEGDKGGAKKERKYSVAKSKKATNLTCSKTLMSLLYSFKITGLRAIGIKIPRMNQYVYTVFVQSDESEDTDESSDSDSDDVMVAPSMILYTDTPRYKEFQAALTKGIKGWRKAGLSIATI